MVNKVINSITLGCFIVSSLLSNALYAQEISLPGPGALVSLSPASNLPGLYGMKIDPRNPFKIDFLVNPAGNNFSQDQFKAESLKLIKYFLASLTVPEKDLWVNLSPYESDRVIPLEFGQTEMGRDLLAQDYVLKKLTSSLLVPASEIGETFWKKVYSKAYQLYGTTDIPIDTFYKVWIIPMKAVVYEQDGAAFIGESRLKVMLDADYAANGAVTKEKNSLPTSSERLADSVLRDLILPLLEQEVNEGQNFASLRQVYQALILASWFKRHLKNSALNQVYADRNKIVGVDLDDKKAFEKIYSLYIETFRRGASNLIREEYDPYTEEMVPRKYFTGGFTALGLGDTVSTKPLSKSVLSKLIVPVLIVSTLFTVPQTAGAQMAQSNNRSEQSVSQPVQIPGATSPSKRKKILKLVGLAAANAVMAYAGNRFMVHKNDDLRPVQLYNVGLSTLTGALGSYFHKRSVLEGALWGGIAGNGMFLSKGVVAHAVKRESPLEGALANLGLHAGFVSMKDNLLEGKGPLDRFRTGFGPLEVDFNIKKATAKTPRVDWGLDAYSLWGTAYAVASGAKFSPGVTARTGTLAFTFNGFRSYSGLAMGNTLFVQKDLTDNKRLFYHEYIHTADYKEQVNPLSSYLLSKIERKAPRFLTRFHRLRFGKSFAGLLFYSAHDAWVPHDSRFVERSSYAFEKLLINKVPADYAQKTEPVGGIDLDPEKIAMSVEGDNSIRVASMEPAALEEYRQASGLSPVILSIVPTQDLPVFFGLSAQ